MTLRAISPDCILPKVKVESGASEGCAQETLAADRCSVQPVNKTAAELLTGIRVNVAWLIFCLRQV